MKGQYLCINIPKLMKTNNIHSSCTAATTTAGAADIATANNRLSGMSLLERFREAVFRLIMLSALSKTATAQPTAAPDACSHRRCFSPDPHNSEAVAECIEFIKKSASTDADTCRHSTSSTTASVDGAADEHVVLPLPLL